MKRFTPNWLSFTLGFLAIALWLFAVTGVWFTRTVTDQTRFVSSVTNALNNPQVRQIIATTTVDQLFQDQPILNQAGHALLVPIIDGLLSSSTLQPVWESLATQVHQQIVINKPADITLNLSTIRDVAILVANLSSDTETQLEAQAIPNSITLVEKEALPSLRPMINFFITTAPPVAFSAILTLGLLVWFSASRATMLKIISLTLSGTSFLYLLVIKYGQLLTITALENLTHAILISSLYSFFTRELTQLVLIHLILGLIFFLLVYLLDRYPLTQLITDMRKKSVTKSI